MAEDSNYFWVALSLVKGIGATRMRALLDYFGDAQTAWQAPPAELEKAGLPAKLIETLCQVRNSDLPDKTWLAIQNRGIKILTWESAEYPLRLMEIEQPPPVLYLRGELSNEDQWAVGIVGTRRATAYGRQAAEDLAAGLAQNGITIVSGLARGVDAIAHQASLRAGGRTLAVLGCGVDQIYPPEHHRLAEQIISQGALLSDYPPGTAPEAANFPPRNRIISGLSLAIIVVEASEKSGALITAAFAAEQGRAVFALPGSIYAPQSKGTNRLIQEGAHLTLGVNDVLEILHLTRHDQQRAARTVLPADAVEAQLYTLLGREPLHVDEICNHAGLPIEQVSATLAMMELKGLVRQVGGMHYIAVRDESAEYQV
jgi:DNA processing protein